MKKFSLMLALFTICAITLGAQNTRFEDENADTTTQTKEGINPTPPQRPQSTSKPTFWERTRFGGNLGVSFSSFYNFVNISPRMYYLATEKLWLGAGVTFMWTHYKNYPPPYDDQFIYGLNLSAQYFLIGPIFLQAEYEPLNFESYTFDLNNNILGKNRLWTHSLFLGGGLSQPLGNRGRMFISVMYNITWSNELENYYTSPWVFRIGVGI